MYSPPGVVANTGTASGPLALLVSVNVSGAEAKPTSWLPKLSDPGVSVNPGTPVPVSVAVSVMPADSTFSVALSAPSRLGVNTTVIVAVRPGRHRAAAVRRDVEVRGVRPGKHHRRHLRREARIVRPGKGLRRAGVRPPPPARSPASSGASDGCPPSSVSSNSMYSSSFSCGVIAALVLHSSGEDLASSNCCCSPHGTR